MRKIYFPIISFILLACTTMTAWAAIPPPVVNQNLGMPDTQFYKLFESSDPDKGARTCKRCHKPEFYGCLDDDPTTPDENEANICVEKPAGIPKLLTKYLPDRHHRNVGTEIAGGPEQPPYPDADATPGDDTVYTCLNCHRIKFNAEGRPDGLVDNFRDCMNCHVVNGIGWRQKPRTVHHDTPKAWAGKCGDCHGYLVRNVDEGAPPRTYQPSMITPQPRDKAMQDLSITSTAKTHPGNCDFCHNTHDGEYASIPAVDEFAFADYAGDGTGVVFAGTSDNSSEFSAGTPGLPFPGFGPIDITPNWANHHMTGVPGFTVNAEGKPTNCDWCHYSQVLGDPQAVRTCQRCHDVPSLHSIEADVAGDGIVQGAEDPYNGHIGNQSNCWGCHGFDDEYRSDAANDDIGLMSVGVTIPQLHSINAHHWPEGNVPFNLELKGNGFTNVGLKGVDGVAQKTTFTASVQFTHENGDVTVLEPFTAEPTYAVVTVPSTLAAGGYKVQINKDGVLSNPIDTTIIPVIKADGAACYPDYNDVVLISGSQFSEHLDVPGSGTGISSADLGTGMVIWWDDLFIAVVFPTSGCPDSVEIKNVFDSVTVPVGVSGQ